MPTLFSCSQTIAYSMHEIKIQYSRFLRTILFNSPSIRHGVAKLRKQVTVTPEDVGNTVNVTAVTIQTQKEMNAPVKVT